MADVHSKEVRSYNMSRIKGKNTKPEMVVRRFLHANGFGYKLHEINLSGNPDIEMPKNNMAVENISGFKNNVGVTSLISIFFMR